jgi:hypothetical protein
MKKTILKKTVVDGEVYLLPKREDVATTFIKLERKGRKSKAYRVPNSDFAEFIEMGILIALFGVVMVLSAF